MMKEKQLLAKFSQEAMKTRNGSRLCLLKIILAFLEILPGRMAMTTTVARQFDERKQLLPLTKFSQEAMKMMNGSRLSLLTTILAFLELLVVR